jgi:Protein of unknown function (DUF1552)
MKFGLSHRRQFLERAALGTSAYFLPSLWGKRGEAAVAIPPRRLLLMTTQHSNPYQGWMMRRPGLAETADWEIDLKSLAQDQWSKGLKDLYPHRNKLMVLDTLSNAIALSQGSSGGHFRGQASILTGSKYQEIGKDVSATGASIDQIVAEKNFVNGGVRSVEFGEYFLGTPFTWGKTGTPIAPQSPGAIFAKLFTGRDLNTTPALPGDPPATALTRDEKLARQRGKVAAFARDGFRDLASRISVAEKQRLQQHADLLNDLTNQLGSGNGEPTPGGGTPIRSAGCSAPTRPDKVRTPDAIAQIANVIAMGFACDVTRVASVQFTQLAGSDFGGPSGDIHQTVAHHDAVGSTGFNNMVNYYAAHARHLSTLLSALDAVQESDGTRLLDNTLVLWVPESGSWIHQQSHIPAILAGGAGLKMGRYLHWPSSSVDVVVGRNSGAGYAKMGPPISRLLVSIARQFGITTNQIGNASGAYMGMDVTGALDRLI